MRVTEHAPGWQTMDAETLEALKGSIAKWEAIVAGTGVDDGTDNCPLCQRFNHDNMVKDHCVGCPASKATGQAWCLGSPFAAWTQHQNRVHGSYTRHKAKLGCPECARSATAELDFLKSLLPPAPAASTEKGG